MQRTYADSLAARPEAGSRVRRSARKGVAGLDWHAGEVGVAEGLEHDSVVNLDRVRTIDQRRLMRYCVGSISSPRMARSCRALEIATGV
ncbi:MAG: type II toxin-antitoxin system PemK/MazF family toxin [Gemmatimonadota bacterium]|nr:type II toxin-antitoxin system PemK/MazF family toxin [Gemmatimonadota bacterium]MDE2871619.1 type II toxin-antitoxin system PemK/MazF family toxin [Gemmatimonadota bacterium]